MTGRERMKIAMSGGRPDRVPTMPQICHTHCVSLFYDDYRTGVLEVIENPEMAWELVLKTADYYDVDGLRLFRASAPYKTAIDGDGAVAFDPKTSERVGKVDVYGGGWVVPDEPALPVSCEDDLKSIPRPKEEDIVGSEWFTRLKKAIDRAHPKYFVASSPPGWTVNYLSDRRGREQALLDLALEPDLSKKIMDVGLEIAIEEAKALVKLGIDALYIGDPSSSSSLISPNHWEEFCLPRFKTFCDELHKEDILIYIHICGNTNPILEMMADTGADCVEPLDPLGGVDVGDAKKRIGHRVSLMGGVNTITLLKGTPDEVRTEAERCCRLGGIDGAYILAAGDMVPDFAPSENIKALVEVAKSFKYSGEILPNRATT